MWDSTAIDRQVLRVHREPEGKISGIPHLAKNERDMGHPAFVTERGSHADVFPYHLLRRNVRVIWLALQLAEFFHLASRVRSLSLFAINASQAKVCLCGKRSIFL